DLLAVQQQLAAPAGSVVGPGALGVFGDVDAVQPDLAVVDVGEAVDERGPTLAQRLDLRAGEHHAGLEGVVDVVVVPRLLVLGDQLATRLLGHGLSLSGLATGFGLDSARPTTTASP